MSNPIDSTNIYKNLLNQITSKIDGSKSRVLNHANAELISLYWQIGKSILDAQADQGWGAKVVDTLAADLRTNYPDSKGFSVRNLKKHEEIR